MKLPGRRYVLSVLALALLVGGFWVYRLIWGRPLDVDHFFERVFLEWFLTDPELMSQLERYVVAPGQACSYYVGMTTILELGERSRRELGERFDLRDFHDAVLRHGQMPLEILERVVDEHMREFVD